MATMTHRNRIRRIACAVVCACGGLMLVAQGMAPRPAVSRTPPILTPAAYLPFVSIPLASTPPDIWLAYVNDYRAMAVLPSVTENASFSTGDRLHARYIVKNDVLQHTEDPANPWYTPEGLAAAQSSNLAASYSVNEMNAWAIDAWMQAPFHAVGVLDPSLLQVGFGSYREADEGLQMGAALDVIRGLTYSVPSNIVFPIPWPANGTTVPIRLHWGETPSPLTSCPGYSAPAGLPVILQIGPGDLTPHVTAHSFFQGSTPLAHCLFDETNYANPDPSQQNLGRAILDARDAIVLMPRAPLTTGANYVVSITVNGQTVTWAFTVSSTARATEFERGGFVR